MGSILCLQTNDVEKHTNPKINKNNYLARGLGIVESDEINKNNHMARRLGLFDSDEIDKNNHLARGLGLS